MQMGHLLNAVTIEKLKNKLATFIRMIDSAAPPQPAEGGYAGEEPEQGKGDTDANGWDNERAGEEAGSGFPHMGPDDMKSPQDAAEGGSDGMENYQILRKTSEGDFHLPEASTQLFPIP
jgi:hypothetical protein